MIVVFSRSTVGHRVGGLESYVDRHIRWLRSTGYGVRLVTTVGMSSGYAEALHELGVEVVALDAASTHYSRAWYEAVRRGETTSGEDTAIFHGLAGVGYRGLGRLITVTHGSAPLSLYNASLDRAGWRGAVGRLRAYLVRLEPYGLRKHIFVALSDFDARLTRWSYLASRSRVRVIPPEVAVVKRERSLIERPKTILYVGRIQESKGVFDLIRAWQRLRERRGFQLWMVGDGPSASEVERLQIPGFRYLGAVPPSSVPDMLAEARWLVAPGRYRESYGLTAAEALKQGTPVLYRRRGALPETVGSAGWGYRLRCELPVLLRRLLEIDDNVWSALSMQAVRRMSAEDSGLHSEGWSDLLGRP